MNTAAKLGSYALGLAVVFGGALGVGTIVGPEPAAGTATAAEKGHAPEKGHAADKGHAAEESHGAGEGDAADKGQTGDESHTGDEAHAGDEVHADEPEQQTKSDTPGGLQVSQNGYTLNPITSITTGVPTDFKFTVIGPDGKPVTDYQVEHDKKMHFIVASRDLTSFQHVHPELIADGTGTWSVRMTLPKAGAYRGFADFVPTGGEKITLGADLQAAGDYRPEPLPHVSRTAAVDDYTVNLAGDLVPGRASKLTLTVSKDGKPVTDLEPYLGAYGHLVALRAGDLAYLHVHPEESEQAGPEVTFFAQAPSRGDYRLFLDFKHEGKVRTASFTATATLSDGHAPSATHDHSH